MSGRSDPGEGSGTDEADPDEVGPRHAYGNRGWNEPVDDAPETLEGAVRRDVDGESDGGERDGGEHR